jgi:hypothetical protein
MAEEGQRSSCLRLSRLQSGWLTPSRLSAGVGELERLVKADEYMEPLGNVC